APFRLRSGNMHCSRYQRPLVRFGLAGLVAASCLLAQDSDRVTVPFSDPAGAKRLNCNILDGNIIVKTHAGREVIIEAQTRGGRRGRNTTPPPGMRRISDNTSGLTVEESGNLIKVTTSPPVHTNLTIFVPAETSLKLSTVNNGSIEVEGVSGE